MSDGVRASDQSVVMAPVRDKQDCHMRVETSPHHMLHRLWSACVDKPGYDKAAWREIERQLKAVGIVR